MPGLTGLEVAAATAEASPATQIVFVTAYDQYAIQAFERGAVDYLLKPVEEERLALTVARLKERLGGGRDGDEAAEATPGKSASPSDLAEIIDQLSRKLQLPGGGNQLRWIKATVGANLRLIPIEEVVYFQAEDKYTRVFTAQAEALIRKPIKELVEELDPAKFWQIHRATIVNAGEIAGAARDYRDRLLVSLKNRSEKPEVSRTYTHLFRQM
jgi:DNA-binding LytR/AlgR family response regulator